MPDTVATESITRELIAKSAPYIPGFAEETGVGPASPERPWKKWIEADLGFRNHWYPLWPGRKLREGEHQALPLLGEDILLLRRGGKVYAIEDRCSHRGTRLSMRPICYTDDTITCWHHAITFNLSDGRVACVLNDPQSGLEGHKGIKSYPVRDAKGILFVFVGDIAPPPLSDDVPPGFFDEDVAVRVTDPYVVNASWRLGCEGGYDPGHHYIHNWSRFAINAGLPMSFGWVSKTSELINTTAYVAGQTGPKGFTREARETSMAHEAVIPGNENRGPHKVTLPLAVGMTEEVIKQSGEAQYTTKVGLWMPCGLKVDPWPWPGVVHNEYYVPRDAKSHYYFQCGWKRVKNEAERKEWEEGELGHVRWEVPVPQDFTVDDAMAREGIAKFYAEEGGWDQEQLARSDIELVMWRIFASQHARGIQKKEHTLGHFKR